MNMMDDSKFARKHWDRAILCENRATVGRS